MDKKLSENMPIYVQIMNSVKGAIAAGELAVAESAVCTGSGA